jgi:hypothetical protein
MRKREALARILHKLVIQFFTFDARRWPKTAWLQDIWLLRGLSPTAEQRCILRVSVSSGDRISFTKRNGSHRMKKYLVSFVAVAGLALAPAGTAVASTCPSGSTIYCVPSAVTPTEAAHATSSAAAAALSKLKPAALAGKGGVTLSGTAAGPGTIKVLITARIHGKTVVIGSGTSTAGSAGLITVKLVLTKAGKRALKGHKGKLQITVSASFTPTGGKATTASSKVGLK